MNMEDRIRIILNKINDNDFVFTETETFILNDNVDLRKMIFQKIAIDFSSLSDAIYNSIVNDMNINHEDEWLYEIDNLLYNLGLKGLEKGEMDVFFEAAGTCQYPSYVLDSLDEKLKDSSYKITRLTDEHPEITDLVIKNDRIDIIIELINNRSLNNMENRDTILEYINNNILNLNLEEIEILLKSDFKINLNIFDTVIEKIKDLNGISSDINFNYFFNICPSDRKKELFDILISKGYISIPYLLSEIADISDYFPVISDITNKGTKLHLEPLFEQAQVEFNNKLQKNKEIFWLLIQNGQIEAINCLQTRLTEEEISIVVELIKNNPQKYKGKKEKYNELPPKIIAELMLIPGQPFPIINEYKGDNHNFEQDVVKKAVIERIKRGDYVKIPQFFKNDDEIIDSIIKSKSINYLLELDIDILGENYIDRIIYILESDEEVNTKFFDKNNQRIIDNNKLLFIYLNSEIYCNQILLNIQHRENYEEYYTEELYLNVSDYLARRYGLNKRNMNILESQYGPMLVHYISNNSIQEIINLNESDFDKFISIFPNSGFEMKDAEAIYDSLKQYDFSNKNSDVLGIFNRI